MSEELFKGVPLSMYARFSPVEKSLWDLRDDAMNRGMFDLAVVYCWSMLRLVEERIKRTRDEAKKLK